METSRASIGNKSSAYSENSKSKVAWHPLIKNGFQSRKKTSPPPRNEIFHPLAQPRLYQKRSFMRQMHSPELEDGSRCTAGSRRGTGRWLRVSRWVGVVLCNTRDQSSIDQRLQVGDQRLGPRLRVDLMTLDVKSEDV